MQRKRKICIRKNGFSCCSNRNCIVHSIALRDILTTEVNNHESRNIWPTDGSDNTYDKIFLLSYAEMMHHFNPSDTYKCVANRVSLTKYAAAKLGRRRTGKDKTEDGKTSFCWWLRSAEYATYVNTDGTIMGADADANFGVRPALWVQLATEAEKAFEVVSFGTYPQAAEGDDNTPIEWLVLEDNGNSLLLLSKYALDSRPYLCKSTGWAHILR